MFLRIIIIMFILMISLILLRIAPIPYNIKSSANNYFLSLLISKHQFLEKTKSPRLIFVGGSGLFYGLDSKKISNKLEINVVNVGLYAPFGLKFMLEDLKHYIRKGDMIIIVPEYGILTSFSSRIGKDAFKMASYIYPIGSLKYLNTKDGIDLFWYLKSQITILQDKFYNLFYLIKKIRKENFYSISNYFQYGNIDWEDMMNEYGDRKIYQKKPNDEIRERGKIIITDNNFENSIKVINDFKLYTDKMNADVYFIFSCYPDSEYEKNKEIINEFYVTMKNKMNVEILSPPENYVFPDIYFLDTVNHLNLIGKESRTEKVIKDLSSKVNNDKNK